MVHAGPKALIAVALGACGRVGFDAVPGAVDGEIDAVLPVTCPVGYVAVPGDVRLGTTDFCVMRTEAKAWSDVNDDGMISDDEIVSDGMPTASLVQIRAATTDIGMPWVEITALMAFDACRALGDTYHLISNREWMTIARNAEQVSANWSSGTPGTGRIVEGNTDAGPALAIADPLDGYSGTGNAATDPVGTGWEQRRTLVLSTTASVWDLPGNVQEWVDWTRGGPYDGAPACDGGELDVMTCAGYVDEDFNSASGTLNRTHGAGYVIGGMGDAVRRGGQVSDRVEGLAGLYSLNMLRFVDDTFGGTGFRCVVRP